MTTSRTARLLSASLVLALAVGLGAAVPAGASTTTEKDPKDDVFLASVGGGIDLASVRLTSLDAQKRIRVTFSLHSPVPKRSLAEPGGLAVHFIKKKRIWRVVRVFTVNGALRGEICSYPRDEEYADPYDCTRLPARKVDARTYRVLVKLEQIKEGVEVLRWTAASLDISNGFPVSDRLEAKNGKPFRWRL